MSDPNSAPVSGTPQEDTQSDANMQDAEGDLERSLLRTENERLRQELERTTQTTYRRTALALLVVGLSGIAGGVAFPAGRTVLVVVGAIGVFGGILTWYLTPDTVLSVSVAESITDAHARTVADLQRDLDLRDDIVYAPAPGCVAETKVFLPLHAAYELPEDLDDLFQTDTPDPTRGVALQPTGAQLYRALDRSLDESLDAGRLPDAVPEGLVEQFELATSARGELDTNAFTVQLEGPAIDRLDRPDHPIVSFVGVATAQALDQPIRVDAVNPTDGRITLTW